MNAFVIDVEVGLAAVVALELRLGPGGVHSLAFGLAGHAGGAHHPRRRLGELLLHVADRVQVLLQLLLLHRRQPRVDAGDVLDHEVDDAASLGPRAHRRRRRHRIVGRDVAGEQRVERLHRIDDLGQRRAARTVRQRQARLRAIFADADRDAGHPRGRTQLALDRHVLIERRVLRLAALDVAAGQDRARRVVPVGVRHQVDPLDRQDLALEALAVRGGVVEGLQHALRAAAGVGEVEGGLGVAAQAREPAVQRGEVLRGDAVRVVDAAEAQGQRLAGLRQHGVLQQAVERQRRGAGANGLQE